MQNTMIIGVYLWGALYTTGIFVAGLMFGNHAALYLALVSAGAAYLAQFAGALVFNDPPISQAWAANAGFTLVAILAGIGAGVALIIGA